MKSKINFSRLSIVLTALLMLALFVGCIATVHDAAKFITLLSIYLILICCALWYAPWYVAADSEYVIMRSLLRRRKIRVSDIKSIRLFQPTMGAIRVCGSGGFLGYWGIYREGDIGRYQAFYGKASECFLIQLKNGDKYVLSCADPAAMVDYISSAMKERP